MKKLLLLSGARVHCKVVEAAKEMGVYIIVADNLEDSPAKLIADEKLLIDIFDISSLIKYGKENNISGVLGFCIDPTQRPAQQIAEQLDLPMFGDKFQVLSLTDKNEFKKLCLDNSVDIVPEYFEKDLERGIIQYPVLVKPNDSRGSRGIAICNDKNELQLAIISAKQESSNGKALIEKYMGNNMDLTISYVVKDGNPALISVGDRYPGKKEDGLDRQLACTIQPSRYLDMYINNVNDRVVNMIKNLGIKNGLVFMQGFVDEDTVRMYDPGIRLPGNEYERIYEKATGINVMKSIVSYAIGGEILDHEKMFGSYDLNGKCAIQYMINVGPGIVGKISGLQDIKNHPSVVDVGLNYGVGHKVEQTNDIKHRIGEISILINRNKHDMIDVIKFIQSNLKITSNEGENMIISPFDTELIELNY